MESSAALAFPATCAQRGIWLANTVADPAAYHIPIGLRLRGRLDRAVLGSALAGVIARHEALRTSFRLVNGELVQIVREDVAIPLRRADRPAAPPELERLLREEARAPFDLEAGPLIRALLVATDDPAEHVLVVTFHHLITDMWSCNLFVHELSVLYRAGCTGGVSGLVEPGLQFGDFAVWERDWLAGGGADEGLGYWRGVLAGVGGGGLVFGRSAGSAGGAGSVGVSVPAGVGGRLAGVAAEAGVTPFMVLAAVFGVVVGWFGGGGEEVVLGTALGSRVPELRSTVGCLVNTVALRVGVGGGLSFRELLAGVRDAVLGAMAQGEVPFERVARECGLPADLIQAFIVLQNGPAEPVDLPGVRAELFAVERGAAQFDLNLQLWGAGGGYSGFLEFRSGAVDEVVATGLVECFERVLAAVVGDLDVMVDRLAVVGDGGVEVLGWGSGAVVPVGGAGGGLTLPGMLAGAVTGRAGGVVCGDVVVGPGELDRWGNRLARLFVGLGVGPESLVVVAVPRSTELVAAVWGVLKAGGGYVPVDPGWPAARRSFVVGEVGARVVVTSPEDAESFAAPGVTVVAVGRGVDPAAGLADGAVGDDERLGVLRGDHPAYVIYTSGSTGRPKGVVVSHASAVNRLVWMRDEYGIDRSDRILLKTPATFDVSVWELLLPALVGATQVIAAPDGHRDPMYLARLMAGAEVTTVHFVPSMLAIAAEVPAISRCTSLRRVIASGEALMPDTVRAWQSVSPAPLHNLYGPTEAAVDVTFHDCARDADRLSVPIGRPVWNVDVYVLDRRLRLAPVGVIGELYLAGRQLARGYVHQPALTADRFVANPYAAAGERMYRTGDLVRWNAAGEIEYVGRADHQVKLSGQRVEIGEIEAVLAEHPAVTAAAAVVWPGEGGRQRLAAYATLAARSGVVDPGDLRAYLASRLPEIMVPSTVQILPAMPLSAHGKLDRAALPAPSRSARHAAPRSTDPVVSLMRDLFAEVLGARAVADEDSFFDLGGDSIGAMALVGRARSRGCEFDVRDVFDCRTPVTLARRARVASVDVAVAEEPADLRPTPIMHWLRETGGAIGAFAQYVVVQPPPAADPDRLSRALRAVVDRHEMLRVRLSATDTAWHLDSVPAPPDHPPMLIEQPHSLRDEAAIRSRAAWASARLDLAGGRPLLAVWDGRSGPGRLLIIVHHLAVDGVSWRTVLADLAAAYASGGAELPPPGGMSFRRWSAALHARAVDPSVVAELADWRAILSGPAAGLTVPGPDRAADRPGRAVNGSARHLSERISGTLTRQFMDGAARAFHLDPKEAPVVAAAIAVDRWLRERGVDTRSGVLFDIEGHGRDVLGDRADTADTVGWFTSMFPVRLGGAPDDPGAEGLARLVKLTKEQLRSVPHGGRHFGLLRYLNVDAEPELSGFEAPQVLVNYLGRVADTGPSEWSLVAGDGALGGAGDPAGYMSHGLTVTLALRADADGERMDASLTWPDPCFTRAEIARLAALWTDTIEGICRATGRGGRSPSDVPLTGLNQADIEMLEAAEPGMVDILPLSPMQEGILFHSRLAGPDDDAYTLQVALDLVGPVDEDALGAAVGTVFQRHPNLRVAFRWSDVPRPLQLVFDSGPRVRVVDLSGRPDEVRAEELERLERAERRRFELDEHPLVRVTLARLTPGASRLVISYAHAILDGWSLPLLVDALFRAYRGEPAPVAGRYADYLRWLGAQDARAATEAWRAAFAGADGRTELVRSAPGTRAAGGRGEVSITVPETVLDGLRLAGRRHGLTLATLIQGAWAIAVSRATGRDDVVVGTVLGGRPPSLPAADRMIGIFINTVPLRMRLRSSAPVVEALREGQDTLMRLASHAFLPLSQILRTVGDAGAFDSLVVVENYPLDRERLGAIGDGLTVVGASTTEATHYPIAVVAVPGLEGLTIRVSHLAERFDRARATTLAEAMVANLADLAGDLDRPVGRIGARPGAAVAGAAGDRPRPAGETLIEAVDRQAAAHPDRIAVSRDSTALSYRELNGRANRLARHLIERGAGPGGLVGVHVGRTPDLVVAILAVVKSGAAYLPLDPSGPAEHLTYLIDDAAPVALVSDRDWPGASGPTPPVVRLDDPETRSAIAVRSDDGIRAAERPRPVHACDAATVVYTSDPSGTPEGVVVTHDNVLRLFRDLPVPLDPGPDDVWTAFHPTAADLSVWEIWGALLHGSRAVVVDHDEVRSPGEFLALLAAEGVTVLSQTPSAFRRLIAADEDDPETGRRLALRSVILSGALDPAGLAGWRERHPERAPALITMYGMTAATVHVTAVHVHGPTPADAAGVIGTPPADVGVRLLDSALRPVAEGFVGEVYVSGAGLARGYLHRAALTATRFVADPFGPPGARLYRSGDLAYRRADGTLVYAGRGDDRAGTRGGPPVVPEPATARSIEAATGDEPRDELEAALADIWADVLDVTPVGVHMNFFDLGGHSLLAARVASRIRQRLGVDVPIVALFESTTIATLAARIADIGTSTRSHVVAATRVQVTADDLAGMFDDFESDDFAAFLGGDEDGDAAP